MLDVKSYVRDFYAYKRSQCPELILTKMDTTKGLEQLQRQVRLHRRGQWMGGKGRGVRKGREEEREGRGDILMSRPYSYQDGYN